jgi:20S proteasome alpha/beta subunit
MQEAENVRFNISGAGGSRSNFVRTTLKNVYDAIDEKVIDESARESLKKAAANYPFQALNNFILNLDKYVSKEITKNSFKNKKEELEFPE